MPASPWIILRLHKVHWLFDCLRNVLLELQRLLENLFWRAKIKLLVQAFQPSCIPCCCSAHGRHPIKMFGFWVHALLCKNSGKMIQRGSYPRLVTPQQAKGSGSKGVISILINSQKYQLESSAQNILNLDRVNWFHTMMCKCIFY